MTDINKDIEALEQALLAFPREFKPGDSLHGFGVRLEAATTGFSSVANVDRITRLLSALKESQADALEQAKIAGMGGERELALMAKLDRAVRLLKKARPVLETECFDADVAAIDAFLKENHR